SPPRSNGSSPAKTSTASPSDSPSPPPKPPDHEYVGELPSQSTKGSRRTRGGADLRVGWVGILRRGPKDLERRPSLLAPVSSPACHRQQESSE
ncbi:MAG: hypothetical protein WA484_01990, partial [Solirubrobacteraceae bacterium]